MCPCAVITLILAICSSDPFAMADWAITVYVRKTPMKGKGADCEA